MTNKNNIPAGYKDSAVGIIPQEWEVKYLGDLLARLANGLTYDVSVTSGYPVSRIETISSGEINYSKVGYIDNVVECELYKMQKGDILYSHINSLAHVGKVAYYDGKQELYHGMNLLLMRVNDMVDSNYLYAYMLTSQAKHIAQVIAKPAVNQASISINDIRKIKLPVPPMEEQRKIAEILGVWDEAIEKQSRLIEKLELRKRALMQRLLTGRTRLPGFTTPWQKVKLGEIGTFLSTNTLSRDKLNDNNGSIQNIHYGDILVKYSSIVDAKLTAIPYVNEDVAISSDYLENGDIVFSDTAEDNIVGKAVEISNIADKKIVAGLHTMLFRPNKGSYAQHFLGYYLNSDAYRKQLAPLIQGIKVCSISKRAICHTIVLTPSLPEQKAIAEVLTVADNEIATHRKKLDALRLQKRGLMQQLLTGKTRVKI